eukprot:5728387-Amphidinium_carterae.1
MVVNVQLSAIASRKRGVSAGNAGPQTDEEISAGFNYVRDHAPTETSQNEHLAWILRQRINAESPIQGHGLPVGTPPFL